MNTPHNIPADINAEILLNYFPEEMFKVTYKGTHKRNAYNDVLDIEDRSDYQLMSLGRNSIYESLPEYIFHPSDRFDNLPKHKNKEKFAEEYHLQEQERIEAYRLFDPIDIMLLQIRMDCRRQLERFSSENKIIHDILSDRLTDEQKRNRFISKTIPYLPSCKNIRGDRTLLTLLLRKVFADEGIVLNISRKDHTFTDANPRYDESVESFIDDLYVGSEYVENTLTFDVLYWSDEACDENFLSFVSEIDEYKMFFQDYFMSVDSILIFNVVTDAPAVRLSDTTVYNYLNYNTNL